MTPPKHYAFAPHKLQEYAEIFDRRGRDYHQAMLQYPQAREEEFHNILYYSALEDGQVVCDYPSGGGYLEKYITQHVRLILLETSEVFLSCTPSHSQARRMLVRDGRIPLPDARADRVISLAGLHHVMDKRALFSEVRRCLRPMGRFVLADAYEGSGVARFLNEFVHEHSEEGHEGVFLTQEGTSADLESCGYTVTLVRKVSYPWRFASIADMTEYCRLMFGITRASPADVEAALRRFLGFRKAGDEYHMMWELLFIVAEK